MTSYKFGPIKPKKPVEPVKPIAPNKRIVNDYSEDFDLLQFVENDKTYSLNKEKLITAIRALGDNVELRISYNYDGYELVVHRSAEEDDPHYDTNVKWYKKQLERYNQAVQQYKEELKKYEKMFEHWIDAKKTFHLEELKKLESGDNV